MRSLGIFVFLFFVSVPGVSAQVVIESFYSNETKDWVEIKNIGNQETEITGYVLGDTAASNSLIYEWKSKTVLQPEGSCVVEVGNRLNNGGDTIYLRDSLGAQIDCVSYKGGNGGECSRQGESLASAEKPVSNCVVFTEAPAPVASATPRPNTPSPTVRPVIAAATVRPTAKPVAREPEQVLALKEKKETPSPEPEEETEEDGRDGVPLAAIGLVVGGLMFVGVGAYPFLKKRLYNRDNDIEI